MHDDHPVKHLVDVASALVAWGAVFNFIPKLAALGSLVWYILCIYESKTVQEFIRKGYKHDAKHK